MQKFKYTSINFDKMKFTGTFYVENEAALREELAKQRLYLVKAKAVSEAPPSAFFTATGKISIKELTVFCRQFAVMINAGVSVVDCLEVLKEQSYTMYFRKVLARVYEDVKSGLLLSEAMAKHKRVFPEYFRSMTYVGEVGGVLDKVMISVANYYENDYKIRSKVKSVLAYPIVLFCLTVIVLAVLTLYVIPTFRDSLAVMDVLMPGITLAMFRVSEFFLTWWKEILIVIFVIVAGLILFGKTKKGKYFYDTMKVRIPFMKKIQVATVTSRFARGFGLLIESGMDIVDALDVMANLMGNKNIERRFRMAIEDVKQGVPLAFALDRYKILAHPHGIVLLTGPTGCGKTMTLYSFLRELNRSDVNVTTVEDTVEYTLEGINQIQVNVKADMTFAAALCSILRQDPDIVMIGEIRDEETAEIALRAAITGHLVFSTLHTNDAPGAVTRLVDMGVSDYLVADALVGVISQRLVKRLCLACKKKERANAREMAMLGVKEPVSIYRPQGCQYCGGTGYKGRIAVHEIMYMNDAIRNAVLEKQNAGAGAGFAGGDQDGI